MSENRRVVVTGLGAVSCLGPDFPTMWTNLLTGKPGIGPITRFDASKFRCQIAGEVHDLDITKHLSTKEARRLDPFCHYAVAAADEAMSQAGLDPASVQHSRAGVLVGAGIGGIKTLQNQCQVMLERGPARSSPLMVPMMIIDMASGFLSIRYGFRGPNISVVTACASGGHAIGEAMWMIKRGDADIMLSGGAEACIAPLGLTGFCAMRALSERNDDPQHASRPFDAGRDGFVPAEGAGILVLESLEHAQARGAEILAEIVGYGLTGDAYHITAPHPDGIGAAEAVSNALNRAQMCPEDIGYINAHGTSTLLNDKTETKALKKALGKQAYQIPISSTKSMTGHTLGAAGGIESAICVNVLRQGIAPGTMNYETADPDCDLNYMPNAAREVTANVALNLNLGFGGHNVALIFKRWN